MSNYSFLDDTASLTFVIKRLSDNTNLSEWEKKFVESVKTQGGRTLSDKQKQILSDLWEKY